MITSMIMVKIPKEMKMKAEKIAKNIRHRSIAKELLIL